MSRSILAAAAAVWICVSPVLAGPGEDEKKREREQRRKDAAAAAEAAAEVAARTRAAGEWAARLHTGEPIDRLHAAWNLQALLPESQDTLLRLLRDARRGSQADDLTEAVTIVGEARLVAARPDLRSVALDPKCPEIARVAALVSLAKLLDGESQAILEEVARGAQHSSILRQTAILALGQIEAPTTGPAAELLTHDPDALIRMAGYRAIGWSRDRRYLARCVEGLQDSAPLTASMAAKALGRLNDPSTTDALVEAARKTQFGELSFFILEALGRHKHLPALDKLLTLVQDMRFEAQADAATFLFEVGERRALPLFRTLLEETLKGRPHQPGVDTITAYALGAMEDKDAIPVLLLALEKGRVDVRREAAEGLGLLGDVRAAEGLLKAAATTNDRQLRVRSLLSLGKLRSFDGAGKALQLALGDRDASVRWGAVVALESRGEASAVPALRPLQKDPHPFVATAARSAIALLGGTPAIEKDLRDEPTMVRLRALQREVILRPEMSAARGAINWSVVVGWESYVSTCGGTHPPIEVRVPIYLGQTDNEVARKRDSLEEAYELRVIKADGTRLRERTHERVRGGGANGGER